MDSRDINPISIFLVKKGCASDRLLFRYPFSTPARKGPAAAGAAWWAPENGTKPGTAPVRLAARKVGSNKSAGKGGGHRTSLNRQRKPGSKPRIAPVRPAARRVGNTNTGKGGGHGKCFNDKNRQ